MDICCPKHKTKLDVELITIQVLAKRMPVAVGVCSKCNQLYVSQTLMPGASSITIDKTTYEYLEALHREYPYIPADFIADDEQSPAPTPQVEAVHHKQTLDTVSRKEQENIRKQAAREAGIQEIRERLLSGKTKRYNAKNVKFVSIIPTHCPVDGDELIAVKQVTYMLLDKPIVTAASCCVRCCCAYIQEASKKQKKAYVEKKTQKQPTHKKKHIDLPKKSKEKALMRVSPFVEMPKSTILMACLISEGTTGYVAIVSQEKDISDANGVWWVGHEFASSVLSTVHRGSRQFQYKGTVYKIFSCQKKGDCSAYTAQASGFTDPNAPQTIYVFAHKNIARYSSSNFEIVTAKVLCANRLTPVEISVYYEKNSQRYFINEEIYTDLRRRYGLPYLKLRMADNTSYSDAYGSLKQHSELNLLGYSVGVSSGYSASGRQKLLAHILDGGLLSKAEVINHIEWLIHTRENQPSMMNAVAEWRSDLVFLQSYKIDRQRSIWCKSFQSQYSK